MMIKKSNNPSSSFRFIVIGESQLNSNDANKNILREQLRTIKSFSNQPSFIIYLGGIIKFNKIKEILKDYYPINMFYPLIENKFIHKDSLNTQLSYLPYNQFLGNKKVGYYFDYGNSRFIVLNLKILSKDNFYTYTDLNTLLENILIKNRKAHNFLFSSITQLPNDPNSSKSNVEDSENLSDLWSILDKYQVTIMFTPHRDSYFISHMDSSAINDYTDLTDIISESKNLMVGQLSVNYFMSIDVKDELAYFNVYDQSNNPIKSFTIITSNLPSNLSKDMLSLNNSTLDDLNLGYEKTFRPLIMDDNYKKIFDFNDEYFEDYNESLDVDINEE